MKSLSEGICIQRWTSFVQSLVKCQPKAKKQVIISEVVVVIVKFEMNSQPYWNTYFNSGRYFNSGCDVKLSLKFILNPYWNNYFNTGRYFNSGCNSAFYRNDFFFFGAVKKGTLLQPRYRIVYTPGRS